MADHVATRMLYVRTEGGVVKLETGERVPTDALPGSLERLTAAGVVKAKRATKPRAPRPVTD